MRKTTDIRLKRWEIALLLGIAVTVLLTSWAGYRETELATRVVRLHVLANSDLEEDQNLKLEVRDSVLTLAEGYLANCTSIPQAKNVLEAHLQELADAGAETVSREGYSYPVSVTLETTYFPTKEYEDYALPAVNYQALRVEIGAAEGHNWWCVVFPFLSTDAVSERSETAIKDGLTEEDIALITEEDEGYVFRFQCLEWFGELRQWLSGER